MRFCVVNVFVLLFSASGMLGQSRGASDQLAMTLAQRSMAALAGGATIVDVTLRTTTISIVGSDHHSGDGTFYGRVWESRIDLRSNEGDTRSDVQSAARGNPIGLWKTNSGRSRPYASHNCWTDATWFFPALSSLREVSNPKFVFSYVGQEQHGLVNTQHIRVHQLAPPEAFPITVLSAMDFYLDSVSFLPVAVAFNVHPDNDMGTNIPTEVTFADYRRVSGVLVPFHFQKLLNGGVVLDATVTDASINTGLPDSTFMLR